LNNRILPFLDRPARPVALVVEHVESLDGVVTIIARSFARPELCRLCPRSQCNHPAGGFCVVRVDGYVPDEGCPTFSIAQQEC
jgi:hypothetical protein